MFIGQELGLPGHCCSHPLGRTLGLIFVGGSLEKDGDTLQDLYSSWVPVTCHTVGTHLFCGVVMSLEAGRVPRRPASLGL